MSAGKSKLVIIAAAVLVLGVIGGGAGAGIVVATGGDDDQPITGEALDECTAAALKYTGGGTVTETEVGDDGSAYGVEIHLDEGSQVEVNLDRNCDVIGQEADDESTGDGEADSED